METAVALTSLLQTTGGWGIAAILMVVCWRLWTNNKEKDEKIFDLLDKQNDIMKVLERLEDGRRRQT